MNNEATRNPFCQAPMAPERNKSGAMGPPIGFMPLIGADLQGTPPRIDERDIRLRDFKARPDLAKLSPGDRHYLGTALDAGPNSRLFGVMAVFGKPNESFDASGKLKSYGMALTARGVCDAREQAPNDPEFQKAQLAIAQREALVTRSRQAGPTR